MPREYASWRGLPIACDRGEATLGCRQVTRPATTECAAGRSVDGQACVPHAGPPSLCRTGPCNRHILRPPWAPRGGREGRLDSGDYSRRPPGDSCVCMISPPIGIRRRRGRPSSFFTGSARDPKSPSPLLRLAGDAGLPVYYPLPLGSALRTHAAAGRRPGRAWCSGGAVGYPTIRAGYLRTSDRQPGVTKGAEDHRARGMRVQWTTGRAALPAASPHKAAGQGPEGLAQRDGRWPRGMRLSPH